MACETPALCDATRPCRGGVVLPADAGWSDSEAERGGGNGVARWRNRTCERVRRTSGQRSKERVLQGTQESPRFPNRQVTA